MNDKGFGDVPERSPITGGAIAPSGASVTSGFAGAFSAVARVVTTFAKMPYDRK